MWCPTPHHNGHWVLHHPDKCKGPNQPNQSPKAKDKPKPNIRVDPDRLRAAAAQLQEADVDPNVAAQALLSLLDNYQE